MEGLGGEQLAAKASEYGTISEGGYELVRLIDRFASGYDQTTMVVCFHHYYSRNS
jgi:hypothetical protein